MMNASATEVLDKDAVEPPKNHCTNVCPLCGKPNDCGATDSTPCWCSSVKISESILQAIPREARNVICICRACAGAG